MKPTGRTLTTGIMCLLLLAATAVAQAASGVRVRDALNRVVFLPAPAERIVALAPHIVENEIGRAHV